MNPLVSSEGVPLPWAWTDARAMCKQRGMDLAVFNDEHEIGMAPEAPGWPFWIGEQLINRAWSSVDGCPALLPTTPVAMTNGCGVVDGPVELGATDCSGQLPPLSEPAVVMSAMCETPRPASATCLGNDTATTYVRSDQPLAYAAAVNFCKNLNGNVVVFETTEEYKTISSLTTTKLKARFWIGSKFDGTEWKTNTGCPAIYSWTDGTPGTPATGSCLSSTVHVTTDSSEIGGNGIFLDGVTPTQCDKADELFAVCEVHHAS